MVQQIPTRDSSMPEWTVALESYFGVKLSAQHARFWNSELYSKISNLSDNEISDAIRFATDKDRDKFSGKPTLKDLRIWIFVKRKNDRQERGAVYDSEQDIVSIAKSAMLKAETWLDRWNIMCNPNIYAGADRTTTCDECRQIESWARRRWRDWDEQKAQEPMTTPMIINVGGDAHGNR